MSRGTESPSLLLTFPGGAQLRVPVRLVRRVDEPSSSRSVPCPPEGVCGIAEVRGRIVTLIDPARFVACGAASRSEIGSVLLLEEPYAHLAVALPQGTRIAPPGGTPGTEAPRLTDEALDSFMRVRAVAVPEMSP